MSRHRSPARAWPQSAVLGSGLLVGITVLFLQHELSSPDRQPAVGQYSTASQPTRSAAPTPSASPRRRPASSLTYVVQPGDTVTSISQAFERRGRKVGPAQWRDVLQNPNLIRPGQVVVLGPTGRLSISR